MSEQTEDPTRCRECGFALDSDEHKRGIGLHGHSNGVITPETVETPRTEGEPQPRRSPSRRSKNDA